jgi:pimeloyl-ACP methyl ester carboxylesterase
VTRSTELVEVHAPDGRIIDVLHAGVGDGPVVVCQGGTPSGLAGWQQLEDLVERAGLGLVAYARPGYAASSRREGRTVASAADDTRSVLDHLGVEIFVAFGVSGGGPHSVADAAGNTDRCAGAVVVAGLGPADAPDLDFFDSMRDDGQALFRSGLEDPATLAAIAEGFGAVAVTLDAAAFKASAADTLPAVDVAVMAAPGGGELADYLAATTRSAFSHGVHGLTDDVLAFTKPWGFDVSALACPVTVWHGTADENVPVAHGRWLVDHVPGAEGSFVDGAGHVSILTELPAIVDGVAALAHR